MQLQILLGSLLLSLVSASTFVHMTDIHYDPFYKVGAPASCAFGPIGMKCCRSSSVPLQPYRSALPFGDYMCDSPLTLINATLRKIANQNPDFVLWTGDMVGHDLIHQGYIKNMNTIKDLSTVVYDILTVENGIQVFPLLGNHDTFPIDQFPGEPYTEDLTRHYLKAWTPFFQNITCSDFNRTVLQGGYYSLPLKNRVRVLALNTLYWDPYNRVDHSPIDQETWIKSVLDNAEENGETVWVLGHVAPGASEATQDYTDLMINLFETYASTIRYLFYGHTHKDTFVLVGDHHVGWMPGSVLPDNHPVAFRTYTYDSSSMTIKNYAEFWGDLPSSSSETIHFREAYLAKEAFGLTSMEMSGWKDFWNRMKNDETLFQRWYEFSFVGGLYVPSCKDDCQKNVLSRLYIRPKQ